MVADVAHDPERRHTLRPLVGERHRRATVVVRGIAGHYNPWLAVGGLNSLSLALRWACSCECLIRYSNSPPSRRGSSAIITYSPWGASAARALYLTEWPIRNLCVSIRGP